MITLTVILLINHFDCFSRFDVMNSKRMYSERTAACGFGIHIDEQMSVLDRMRNNISSLRVIGKKTLLPFQKGFLISIASTKGLFAELKSEGKQCLLTAHCNSDPAENFFSCLRTLGGSNDHPGPVECMNRIRLLIMSRDAKIVVENSAVEIEEEVEDNICASILSQTFPGGSSDNN
jgi:hypothetical protein